MDDKNQKKILALLPGACEEFSDCPKLGLDVLYRDGEVAAEIRKAESDSQRRTPVGSLHEMAAWQCASKWAKRSRVLAPSEAMEELCVSGLVSLKVWYIVRGEIKRPVLVRDTPGIIMKNFDTGEVWNTTIIPAGKRTREWEKSQPSPCVFVLKQWEDVLKALLVSVPDTLKEKYSNDGKCNNKVEYMGGASVCVYRLWFRLTPEGEAFLEREGERKKECTDKPGSSRAKKGSRGEKRAGKCKTLNRGWRDMTEEGREDLCLKVEAEILANRDITDKELVEKLRGAGFHVSNRFFSDKTGREIREKIEKRLSKKSVYSHYVGGTIEVN